MFLIYACLLVFGSAGSIVALPDCPYVVVTTHVKDGAHVTFLTHILDINSLEQVEQLTKTQPFAAQSDLAAQSRDLVDLALVPGKGDRPAAMLARAVSPHLVEVVDLSKRPFSAKYSFSSEKPAGSALMVRFNQAMPNLLAIGSDASLVVVDHVQGESRMTAKKHCAAVSFCPCGHHVAALGDDRSSVKVWDVRYGRRVKKLSFGSSSGASDASTRPLLVFHPTLDLLLAVSRHGDTVVWAFSGDAADETPVVVGVERARETDHSAAASPGAGLPSSDAILKKARLLEPAVHAECRSIIASIPEQIGRAEFSATGNVVVAHVPETSCVTVWTARTCGFVAQVPLVDGAGAPRKGSYVSAVVGADGQHLVVVNGDVVSTYSLKKELEASAEEEEGGTAENPMMPYYEHQLIVAICEGDEAKVRKIVKAHNMDVNFCSALDGWTYEICHFCCCR